MREEDTLEVHPQPMLLHLTPCWSDRNKLSPFQISNSLNCEQNWMVVLNFGIICFAAIYNQMMANNLKIFSYFCCDMDKSWFPATFFYYVELFPITNTLISVLVISLFYCELAHLISFKKAIYLELKPF